MEVNEINTFKITNSASINNTATSDELSFAYNNSSTKRSSYSSKRKIVKNLTITLVAISAAGVSISTGFIKKLPSVSDISHTIVGNELSIDFTLTNSTKYSLAIYLRDNTLNADADEAHYVESGEYTYTFVINLDDSYTANFVATNGVDFYKVINSYEIK